ncbi:MAG: HAD family phosphatase [Pseudomonadota bacterium]|nr:HAD family phosphatase [Pseudomonadota bacterium]
MMDKHLKAVLFDMDGVLIESRNLIERVWTSVAAKYDVTVTADFVREHIHGRPGHYTRDELFKGFSLDERLAIKAEVDAMEESAFSPMLPGVNFFLNLLKASDVPMALVTSSWRQRIVNVIEMHCLHGVFCVIVDRDNVAKGKPNPQCYRAAASQLGISARDCLIFEDSVSGVKAGVASRATCLGIGEGDDLLKAGALARFADFDRVTEYLTPVEGRSLRFEHDQTTFLLQGAWQ